MLYKDRNKYKDLLGKWKVCCDRSGHMFYSDEVIKDHRNRVVAKEYRDPIHWSEYPYKIPIENTKLPFRRPIITNNEGVARRQTWSQTHIKWSELHRLWSAKT